MTDHARPPVFKVVRRDPRLVVLATDDWVEAEWAARVENWPNRRMTPLYIEGTHPTHEWDDQSPRRCRECGGWDNGSYGSHAPCGFDWGGRPLLTVLEELVA